MNKSFLQLRLKTIEDYYKDWNWKKTHRPYTHFFTYIASILKPKQKMELNGYEQEFENMWGYRLKTAERLIFDMHTFGRGLHLKKVRKIKVTKGTDTWYKKVKISVDIDGMESHLDLIKEWCMVMCRKVAEEENVSFESGRKVELHEPEEWG